MIDLLLVILVSIFAILTVWLLVMPVGLVAGFIGAFRHAGIRRPKHPQ